MLLVILFTLNIILGTNNKADFKKSLDKFLDKGII